MENLAPKSKRVFVLAEIKGQEISPLTFELLGIGKQIALELKAKLSIVVAGHKLVEILDTITPFVNEVFCLDHPLLANLDTELHASAMEQLFHEVKPDLFLMASTLDKSSLAPILAYKFEVLVITDCINLALESATEHLLCMKPVYGANVISTFKLEKKPYIVTIRQKTGEPIIEKWIQGEVIYFTPILHDSLSKVEVVDKIKETNISLTQAEAIVAGGRGIKDATGLEQLEDLANALKRYFRIVELGATRPLIDSHLVPSSRQIGLTGEKVAPKLYIAVGISGSLQHLTGVLGAKKIIAINNSPKAHIFEVADYGVVGSFEEVVPAFKKKLEELR